MREHEHGGVHVVITPPHMLRIESRVDVVYSEVCHKLPPRAIMLQAMAAFLYNLHIFLYINILLASTNIKRIIK
jgi:hypothetical protein